MNTPKAHVYFKAIDDFATFEYFGYDDIAIYWHKGDCSVRGSIEDIIDELSNTTEINYTMLMKIVDGFEPTISVTVHDELEWDFTGLYISKKGIVNIKENEWADMRERGYDSETIINLILEYNYHISETEHHKIARQLWDEFDSIPYNEEDNKIEKNFHWWTKGTDRFQVWGDIEDLFGVNVKKDFMEINETEIKTNKKENKGMISTPKTDCGRYMNIWSDRGDYDCFIIFHEAENNENVDKAIKETEDVCHHIMQNKYMTIEKKRELIVSILDTYVDICITVIITIDKTKERK